MEAWRLEMSFGEVLHDFTVLSLALLVATLLRAHVGFLQRYLIPNALLAGVLGLLVGPEILAWLPISVERMGIWVYHLLALTFICVGLKGGPADRSPAAIHLGFMQIMCMTLQAIVGIGVMLLACTLLDPTLNPAAGMLLTLGFAMGPGVAYSLGEAWSAYGFLEGGSVGLTIAAAGFLIAYLVGVATVNRSGFSSQDLPASERTGVRGEQERSPAGMLTFSPGAIEPLGFHLALIVLVYALTLLAASGIAEFLEAVGRGAEVPIVWSFHFILANLLALLTRHLLGRFGARHVTDPGLLDRMTGLFADYLIAASIMAIAVGLVIRYAVPIAVMAVLGGFATFFVLRKAASWVFSTHRFARFIGMFGEMTGTLASGLALIRILDPEYRSPVAQDLVLSSAVALVLGFPLLAVINLPLTVFDGEEVGYLVLMGIMAGYLLLTLGAWRLYFRRSGSV
ncbi:MAG: hypothetical protein JJ896_16480 [Rhodothermales bacterium]|nr:hypothetical protein [Rhodothermales bacterium]MBO6781254.1 hypothetical protein [Rhodothermales bacterium]